MVVVANPAAAAALIDSKEEAAAEVLGTWWLNKSKFLAILG